MVGTEKIFKCLNFKKSRELKQVKGKVERYELEKIIPIKKLETKKEP